MSPAPVSIGGRAKPGPQTLRVQTRCKYQKLVSNRELFHVKHLDWLEPSAMPNFNLAFLGFERARPSKSMIFCMKSERSL